MRLHSQTLLRYCEMQKLLRMLPALLLRYCKLTTSTLGLSRNLSKRIKCQKSAAASMPDFDCQKLQCLITGGHDESETGTRTTEGVSLA